MVSTWHSNPAVTYCSAIKGEGLLFLNHSVMISVQINGFLTAFSLDSMLKSELKEMVVAGLMEERRCWDVWCRDRGCPSGECRGLYCWWHSQSWPMPGSTVRVGLGCQHELSAFPVPSNLSPKALVMLCSPFESHCCTVSSAKYVTSLVRGWFGEIKDGLLPEPALARGEQTPVPHHPFPH